MPKYNIAFVPQNRVKDFVALANHLKKESYNYCLGKDSIPHITICQFKTEESQIEPIWDAVCSSIEEHVISVNLTKFSSISFDNKIFWYSLLPKVDEKLHETFRVISKIIPPIRKDMYDPHLTLFNSLEQCSTQSIERSYSQIWCMTV